MPTAKPTPPIAQRKRNRKRKRRLASSSSSSSSSSSPSSDSSDEVSNKIKTTIKKAPLKKQTTPPSTREEESSPSSPSSSTSSSPSSDSENDPPHDSGPPTLSSKSLVKVQRSEPVRARSPSPSPPPTDVPPFLPPEGSGNRAQDEQALRDRFRQFWMASVADAFRDDLEQIRKEPNMTKSRLALLIDSLASGGEAFSSHADESGRMNEMDVVLNSNDGA